jgi:hypothetical protein
VHAPVDVLAPAVELQLEVSRVRELAAWFEVRAHEPMRALEHSLGLRVARVEDDPAELELAAERRERPWSRRFCRAGWAIGGQRRSCPMGEQLAGRR